MAVSPQFRVVERFYCAATTISDHGREMQAMGDETRNAYDQIGVTIVGVLGSAEELDAVQLKIWIRLSSLWLANDIDGLVAELNRVDGLLRDGAEVTAPPLQ